MQVLETSWDNNRFPHTKIKTNRNLFRAGEKERRMGKSGKSAATQGDSQRLCASVYESALGSHYKFENQTQDQR